MATIDSFVLLHLSLRFAPRHLSWGGMLPAARWSVPMRKPRQHRMLQLARTWAKEQGIGVVAACFSLCLSRLSDDYAFNSCLRPNLLGFSTTGTLKQLWIA